MFTVPLYTPALPMPHTYSLCFEIHGAPDKYFNFISDSCTSVNGHYFGVPSPDPDDNRNFHGVDEVHILAVDKASRCVRISVNLQSNNLCTTAVGSTQVSSYDRDGVSVSVSGNVTMVTVPNCVDGALTMMVSCNVTSLGIGFQEFRVIRGLNLNEVSHGIIGESKKLSTDV